MARGLSAPNTATGRALNEVGMSDDPSDVSELGGIATDNRGVVDVYSVSEAERKELGIRDDEQVVIAARDDFMPRRLATLRHRYGSARALDTNPTGIDPCEHMDAHMVAVPKAAYEKRLRDMERAAQAEDAKYKERRYDLEKREELFERDEESLRLRRDMNAEMFADMGIGENGMTAGMSYLEGMEYLERMKIDPEALAERARLGGTHSPNNATAWKAAMRDEGNRRGPQFQIAADYAPKVPAKSALGQVQQRNARPNNARAVR